MVSNDKSPSGLALPRRILVSLQLGGGFFALANVICVVILGYVYLSAKHEPRTLQVKGSAKREIVSDRIGWTGTITSRDPDLVKAYEKLKGDSDRVAAFVAKSGIPDKQVTFSAVTTNKVFQREVIPNLGKSPDGGGANGGTTIVPTSKIEMYVLSMNVDIDSDDMDKVPILARAITSLIQDGIEIDSSSPRYLYSKLSELKIDMLGEATRDATARATQIVSNANGSLGRLVAAKMGVMQINPKGVTDVSDTGNNDTTSLEKEILAVVTVEFELH